MVKSAPFTDPFSMSKFVEAYSLKHILLGGLPAFIAPKRVYNEIPIFIPHMDIDKLDG